LLLHNEKEKTYMTVASYNYRGPDDFQLVMQKADGNYGERLKVKMPINHYRIRSTETNEVLHEYSLIFSVPLKTSYDGQYMVFEEGCLRETVYTMRDIKTGKLVGKAPKVSYTNRKDSNIIECSNGMLVVGQHGGTVMFHSMEYKPQ